jgi:hypothetical protein
MSKATTESLGALHGATAEYMIEVLTKGELVEFKDRETGEVTYARVRPSAATIANILKFLKDNDIKAIPGKKSPLSNLVDSLPFPGTELDAEGDVRSH